MRRRLTGFILPLLLTVLPGAAESGGRPEAVELGAVLDEVVLSVGERYVTRSDLELEARVVLVMGGGTEGAFAPIPRDTVESVSDYLVNQLLILGEVDRLDVFEIDPEELDEEYSRLVSAFSEREDFELFRQALQVAPERLGSILRRNLRVRRYLESRVRLTVRVDDDEVVAFFVENMERFGDRPLEEVQEAIRGYLFKERFEASVRELLSDLRGRTDVRALVEPRPFPALEAPASSRGDEDG